MWASKSPKTSYMLQWVCYLTTIEIQPLNKFTGFFPRAFWNRAMEPLVNRYNKARLTNLGNKCNFWDQGKPWFQNTLALMPNNAITYLSHDYNSDIWRKILVWLIQRECVNMTLMWWCHFTTCNIVFMSWIYYAAPEVNK